MSASVLKERLERIAAAFSGRLDLGFTGSGDLEILVRNEFGSLEILGHWQKRDGTMQRAKAPEKIYHVLASNLAVSAETSLVLGLMLGSELIFKLPGAGLPEFEATVEKLSPDLKARVKLVKTLDEAEMKSCEAVVVYGSDETVDLFRGKVTRNQRALFYGHRISLGVLDQSAGDLAGWAERAAEEVDAYDQRGCLSPQFYWAGSEDEARRFAEYLRAALQRRIADGAFSDLPFEEAAQRRHARHVLRGRRAKIWESDEGGGFTVALLRDSGFFVGPGGRFVLVGFGDDAAADLKEWQGKVSSISVASSSWPPVDGRWEELAVKLGASRLCRMGDLQKPPLSWRHDGRPRLGDLVTWISLDS